MRRWWRSRRKLRSLLDKEQRASALRIRQLLEENERLEKKNAMLFEEGARMWKKEVRRQWHMLAFLCGPCRAKLRKRATDAAAYVAKMEAEIAADKEHLRQRPQSPKE